jgi:intein/homing endonuclease
MENIIVGRDEQDLKDYGPQGTIFIGRHIVGEGEDAHLTNPVQMDVTRPHIILIAGKRGTGKSYSMGIIAEEITKLPDEIRQNLSVLLIDTMGIYWSMDKPNEKDTDILREWGLRPEGIKMRLFVPEGFVQKYEDAGVKVDSPFTLPCGELTAQDWIVTFGFSPMDDYGIALERVLKNVRKKFGSTFSISDIIKTVEEDPKAEAKVKNAITSRFEVAREWGVFKKKGTPVNDFFARGEITVVDVSHYARTSSGWSVRGLIVGLFSRKIFQERLMARKSEEFEVMGGEKKETIPLVWIGIDECLPYKSEIITDNAHTPIGEIVEGFGNGKHFKVMGYDEINRRYGYFDVTNVFNKGKREIIEITTETGRRLECTPEHKILTKSGFVPAIASKDAGTALTQHYSKNKKHIKARLVGHLFGDGWLSEKTKTVGFSGKGNKKDLEKIKKELSEIGFKSGNIYSRITNSEITTENGKKLSVSGTSQELRSADMAFKYFSKICPVIGVKALSKSFIPKWILNASKQEKAEFLAAFFGSDGTAPSKAKGSNFNPIRLSFNKADYLEKNAWEFANQIKDLLSGLGIEITKISKRPGNIRKDGTKTIKIVLTLGKSIKNTIRFLEDVGYRYCEKKEIKANKWLSYLKAREYELKKRNALYKKVIELRKNGLGKIRISKKLSIPEDRVRDWIYLGIKSGVPKKFPKFEKWCNDRCSGDVIYEKITKKQKAGIKNVYDISVDKVHNFVANGLTVHNCHQFIPNEGETAASEPLLTLVKEGREPGISLMLVTQRPDKLHPDALAQADLVIAHRLTSEADMKALKSIMQTYMTEGIEDYINKLPRQKGAAIILDDNSERVYTVQIRPRLSWHAGGSPIAIRKKGLFD